MSDTLPLFPLGTVLFPGLLLPLHVFEPRYCSLVAGLLARPGPRRFGVVAIREGRETGEDGARALYEIGCTATLRRVSARGDGRFDLVTVGTQRFRLGSLDHSQPYLQAQVELLGEDRGEETAARLAAQGVRDAFRSYLGTLSQQGGSRASIPELPEEPVQLSYLVAASMVIDLPAKQALLDEHTAVGRLNAERRLLAHEITMLRALTSAPAPELRYSPYSAN